MYCIEEDDFIVVDDDCIYFGIMKIFVFVYELEFWIVELNFVFGMNELEIYVLVKG